MLYITFHRVNTLINNKTYIYVFCSTDIRDHIRHIEKSVVTKEPRFMSRALRALVSLRRKLNDNVLCQALHGYFPPSSPATRDSLLSYLEKVSLYINP